MNNTKTIIFIHGLFVNNHTWAPWKAYFEAKGYTVHTPANPYHEDHPAHLRAHPHPELGKVGFEDVVNNIVELIDTLPQKPIVIGHSMAGLVVQKLIEMDKAVAGISIDGAPPKNVFAPFQTIKTVFPVLNPFGGKVYMGSKKWYYYAFFNNMSKSHAHKEYNHIAVPESRKIAWDTLLKSAAHINFKKPHNPLLFIGGEHDHIFPSSFTKKIAGRYKDAGSYTDYKSFPRRSHYICGEEGWQEVADYVLNWLGTIR